MYRADRAVLLAPGNECIFRMNFVQAMLGSVFSLIAMGSMFFIAYRALTIGNDVSEIKDILRDMQRNGRGPAAPDPINMAAYQRTLENYEQATESQAADSELPESLVKRLHDD